MDAGICPSVGDAVASGFAREHFGGCEFGDKRLTMRAVVTGDAMMRHPGGTLPQKLPKAELLGFYRFANNPKVGHEKVPACHLERTRELMRQTAGTVLVIHDTTEGDYSGLDIEQLGQIGNGSCRGMLIHSSLAVDYARHEALGLAGQSLQIRREVPGRESVKQSREHPQRESRLWCKGVEAVGPAPRDAVWVNVMDRGGDSFESLDLQHRMGHFYVVRSRTNRNVIVKDAAGRAVSRKLHARARRLPTLGEKTIQVDANHHQQARAARVRVAAGPVRLRVPHVKHGEHGREPLDTWVVHVKELSPPRGQDPLEWILLTNKPADNTGRAWERVGWYQCRPMIEEYHKAQKTGCGMELPQFTTLKALQVVIAIVSVVAVQLLRLRDLSRQDDDRPADDVVAPEYVQALSLWRWKQHRPDLSAKDFLHALGRLGGHLGRPSDRNPGWLVLWRGWIHLQQLVEGMLLTKLPRCG